MYKNVKNNIRELLNWSHPDLHVFSYGGTGTRSFFRYMQQYVKLNSQPNVHYGRLENLAATDCACYLYGDPIDAVLSFFRRNEIDKSKFVAWHYRNLDCVGKPPRNLEEYLNMGYDVFGLEAHFDRYFHASTKAKLAYVKFDSIWDNLDELFEFLNVPADISCFPERRIRKSKRESLPDEQVKVLNQYFESLLQKQKNMPPVLYRNGLLG